MHFVSYTRTHGDGVNIQSQNKKDLAKCRLIAIKVFPLCCSLFTGEIAIIWIQNYNKFPGETETDETNV